MTEPAATPPKRMRLRYAGVCRSCSTPLPAGTQGVYYREQREVACLDCAARSAAHPAPPPVADDAVPSDDPAAAPQVAATTAEPAPGPEHVEEGTAGASARREHQRRAAKREQQIRTAHPRVGGLIHALTDDPQSTQAWVRGAVGEEKLARALTPLTQRGVRLLHDRRIPGSRANIDQIAIAPAGIFVIDAKRYTGRPTLRSAGGPLRPRVETLYVGRRDCSKLVTGVLNQVEIIRTALQATGHDQAPVLGMLCFIDADWPLIGGSFTSQSVRILWPGKIAEHILETTVLNQASIDIVHVDLARMLPPA